MQPFVTYTKRDYELNWHHRLMCEVMTEFTYKRIKRLMICAAPRHGKSELVSRRLPAFIHGVNPKAKIIATSYGADLAHSLSRDAQRIIMADEYKKVFPDTRLNEKNIRSTSSGNWVKNSDVYEVVDHGGVYACAGVGGAITGKGADYLLCDDPIKNREEAYSATYRNKVWEWYTSTFFSRLEKNGSICLTLTRWHHDDLAGRLLEREPDRWTVITLPAIREPDKTGEDRTYDTREVGEPLWENKYDLKALREIQKTIGPTNWSALYQQRPTRSEGSIIKRGWLRYYDALPGKFDSMLQSWDCAFEGKETSDYVVGQLWGRLGPDFYLVDELRGQWEFMETLQAFVLMTHKYPQVLRKIIEKKANGAAIINVMKKKTSGITPYSPTDSKEARLRAVSPLFHGGNIFVPNPIKHPWVADWIEEIVTFPAGVNDDRVDAATQALLNFDDSSLEMLRKLNQWN